MNSTPHNAPAAPKSNEQLLADLNSVQSRALIVGVIAAAVCIIDAFFSPVQFFRSYLFAYVFWLSFPLGGMAIVMMNHLTGGNWGLPIRRALEAASRTLPLMILLFIPVFFGMRLLYSWANPAAVAADPQLQYKHGYMNDWFFIVRTIFYFAVFILWAYLLNRWSAEQDRTGDPRIAVRLESFSGPGLVVYSLLITFGSIDWVMSLEPHWYSTIYGLLFMVIQGLIGMSFGIYVARRLSDYEPIASYVNPERFQDLGNLLLTFVILWAYLAFSQFLIIWSGNLTTEIPWYLIRAHGGWAGLALFLIVFHFFAPFLLLLWRDVKRRMRSIAAVAMGLLLVSLVDVYWLVAPSFQPNSPGLHLLDFAAPTAIGGIWVAAFCRELKRRPLLPIHDPNFAEVFAHGD
jgi:hypothetical protein